MGREQKLKSTNSSKLLILGICELSYFFSNLLLEFAGGGLSPLLGCRVIISAGDDLEEVLPLLTAPSERGEHVDGRDDLVDERPGKATGQQSHGLRVLKEDLRHELGRNIFHLRKGR